jgi:hypothetical protein
MEKIKTIKVGLLNFEIFDTIVIYVLTVLLIICFTM